jgi:hypothetical protein
MNLLIVPPYAAGCSRWPAKPLSCHERRAFAVIAPALAVGSMSLEVFVSLHPHAAV